MLALLFAVGADRYALSAGEIVEILPLVALKRVPSAPPYLAGLLNYHGALAPVVDLNRLIGETPCREWLSSRILLTRHPLPDGRIELLGLLVEQATETAHIAPESLRSSTAATPWLGQMAIRGKELVQFVRPAGLLTDEARALLYPSEREAPPHAHPGAG
ncbi:MAG: chemotaxis protein CheW [Candidatus Competibacter sp.]|nr:chemotaxis protein CheW [Candidatus Competibacter sp.]MDG4582866.1 chemotaxis protein CheW [Candidatus Competibacter sp.]